MQWPFVAVPGSPEVMQSDRLLLFQTVIRLGILQHRMQHGAPEDVTAAMQAAADSLALLQAQPPPDSPHQQLLLHYEVLRTAWLLSRGLTGELQKDGERVTRGGGF